MKSLRRYLIEHLGPGLITGAADDDPSGIATYSQAGARFGFAMLWSVLLTTPLMVGIQLVSARIGLVTGKGIAHNLRDHYPRWVLYSVVGLLVTANTVNIAADIGAMGEALQMLVGGPNHGHALVFGVVVVLLQIFLPYQKLAPLLKWLTLAVFSYIAVLFTVEVPWTEVALATVVPPIEFSSEYIMMLVAVLGTTISPYLFFWQAAQEVEEIRADDDRDALRVSPTRARHHLRRIKIDTWVGMIVSNAVAFAIMLTAAVTFHRAGITNIDTSAQAAQALRPIAGDFAFVLFALGIIGTGLLALPVLAGSAAYAVADAMRWPQGLNMKWNEAKGFYTIIVVSTLGGALIDFTPIDPIKALVVAAVINGVVAVPIMFVMMRMAMRTDVMGPFTIGRRQRGLGWLATALMTLAVAAMFASFLFGGDASGL
jgi:NRAMP (natural resistance-associated macrophage protein)-like metal ion transporter